MRLVEKHIIKKYSEFYSECDKLCFDSKNLYNYSNYLIRQEFIQTSKDKQAGLVDHANYLNYYAINRILIDNKQFDFYSLPCKVSNQTLMMLDKNWKSFFGLCKLYSKNKTNGIIDKPNLPNYLHKTNGRFVVTYTIDAISKVGLRNGFVELSKTNIKIKTDKQNIKQVRIVPKLNRYVIEIIYEQKEKELLSDNGRYCSIDLGLNNLATVGSNVIKPIIINGKPLKSINQYYNKQLASLKSRLEIKEKRKTSNGLRKLTNKRNNKIEDYLHKASRYIINHLVSNNINTLVIGNNKEWKQEINIGKKNNQNFVNIPHARFIQMLSYKAKLLGINIILTEESYTSKCSFLDNEKLCKHDEYYGKRIKRGLFRSKNNILINADLNGSLNILRKVVGNFNYDSIEACSAPVVLTIK